MVANKLRNLKTSIVDFIRSQQLLLITIESFSRFYHQLCLLLFKNKIRVNLLKNIRNFVGRHYPSYFRFPIVFLSFGEAQTASKIFKKPIHEDNICITNRNGSGKVNSSTIDLVGYSYTFRFSFHDSFITHRDSALTIEDSGKISKLCNRVLHILEVYHNNIIQVHRKRLNPENSKEYAIV